MEEKGSERRETKNHGARGFLSFPLVHSSPLSEALLPAALALRNPLLFTAH
jgi:hypothetical protein